MLRNGGPSKPSRQPPKLDEEEEEVSWTNIVWSVVEEYNANTSLHGYRYLTEPGRHWLEKLVWFVGEVVVAWLAAAMILGVWEKYLSSPAVTTVASMHYPRWEVPFPAVAVCNNNRISLAAARRVARQLLGDGGDVEGLVLRMRLLGRLYEPDVPTDEAQLEALHEELLAGYGGSYDIEALMKELTPTCESMLSRCRFHGNFANCTNIFSLRTTGDGYCCTFNYQRYHDDFLGKEELAKRLEKIKAEKRRHLTGTDFVLGLSIVVDPLPWDYLYPLLPFYGFKVMVFSPMEFADGSAGSTVEQLVSTNKEAFMRLDAVTLQSSDAVRAFSVEQRRCLFESENTEFYGYYGYAECLMDCRAWSIRELCGCLSFFIPKRGNFSDCGLQHVTCLAKYTSKWRSLRPPVKMVGLEVERHEGLECPECLPKCSDVSYSVDASYSELLPNNTIDGVKVGNRSVVNIYFGSPNTVFLRQDELFSWYDLLSHFGGLCGLFVGFSLISVVEVLYFFTFRLVLACRGERYTPASSAPKPRVQLAPRPAPAPSAAPAPGPKANLYWREMVVERF